MIRLRPTQIDLTSRDVEQTLQHVQARREALLAQAMEYPGLRNRLGLGSEDVHLRHYRTSEDSQVSDLSRASSATQQIYGYLPDNMPHPARGPGNTVPRTRNREAHVPSPRQRMLTSSNEFLHSYLRYVASRGRPIHDPRQAPANLAAFWQTRAQPPEAPLRRSSGMEEVLRSHTIIEETMNRAEAGHQEAEDDQSVQQEDNMDGRVSSHGSVRIESSLRELQRRFSRQMSLDDRAPSSSGVSDEVEASGPSVPRSERTPSTPRRVMQPATELPTTRRRPRLPPSRLSIAQSPPRSPERERDHERSLEFATSRSASPEEWRDFAKHGETHATTEEFETDESNDIHDRMRQARSSFGNLSLAETTSSISHSSSGVTEGSVVHHQHHQPPQEEEYPSSSSSSDLPSPPSGIRRSISSSSLDPVPAASPAEIDHSSILNYPPVVYHDELPSFMNNDPSVPTTPRASNLLFQDPSMRTPRASQRSIRVYNDDLPPETQPQTPSSRLIYPFNPAFTAPAGLRRVFRFPNRHPHPHQRREGSPTPSPATGTPAARLRALGDLDEQENTSIVVEAERWEQRFRRNDRRTRRHSGDGRSPMMTRRGEDGGGGGGRMTLERTPEREFPPTRPMH
ncbi:MAG: hypothetical protein M1823_005402 [Watsoniomyces obsoletus]|nr:MAG: hypothetical protein M1823_005402 [Watsoniomyces obsoletus]